MGVVKLSERYAFGQSVTQSFYAFSVGMQSRSRKNLTGRHFLKVISRGVT